MAEFNLDTIDVSRISTDPGVYLFKNQEGTVLYVGKARSLRRRLTSYLRPKETLPIKTQSMLSHADNIQTIHTTTEKEALLLEASLIKKYKPKYNIVLRDDKQHILFCIRKGVEYPRVEIVHRATHKNALYFGPFTSSAGAKSTWKVLHSTFPLRRCSDRELHNRTTPCLYYHMKQCLAPCVYDVPKEEYEEYLSKVKMLLRGKVDALIKQLQEEMELASEQLEFEKAILLREQIYAIQKTVEKQAVVLEHTAYIDAIGIAELEHGIALAVVFIREGRVIDSLQFYFPSLTLDDSNEVLYSFISQYYTEARDIPPIILIPHKSEDLTHQYALLEEIINNEADTPIHIVEARSPIEYNLIDIARSNARNMTQKEASTPLSEVLARLLSSDTPITRIEAVDVSHTSGSNTKVGVVVFEEGREKPVDYRSYNIEDAHGDDYKALHIWIQRRIQDTQFPYPDMLLIDGGKGQLSVIERTIIDNIGTLPFPLVAITKARTEDGRSDRRAGNTADRLFIPGRSNPLSVKAGSPELLYLQKIRDAVHDYALGRHRKAHSDAMLQSELDRIKGLGEKTKERLLHRFHSVRGIASATVEELASVQGISKTKAQDILLHLSNIIHTK
ncbi:MAG: excinuclease ABC subunit UvrC [Desulfovibrionaceae bacterium]|nr:excinuclease ABC subunit UvrC [Desulfovibrionaceae bacterium]